MPSLVFDKCCFCIELKTGCFIIGYLGLITNIILMFLTYFAFVASVAIANNEDERIKKAGSEISAVSGLYLLFLVLSFPFSIVLLVGLHKDKPGYVKVALIYNVVISILTPIEDIIHIAWGINTASLIFNQIVSLVINIYFLLVIWSHYYRMKDPACAPVTYNTA